MVIETTRTVLLIEDDPDHFQLISSCIEKATAPRVQTKIVHRADGVDALNYLSEHADQLPQLIVLDLNLPGMSGHEVLQAIKTSHPLRLIPVVVLTTSLSEDDRRQALELQANSVLTKSLNYVEFKQMLQDMINYWLVWNRGI